MGPENAGEAGCPSCFPAGIWWDLSSCSGKLSSSIRHSPGSLHHHSGSPQHYRGLVSTAHIRETHSNPPGRWTVSVKAGPSIFFAISQWGALSPTPPGLHFISILHLPSLPSGPLVQACGPCTLGSTSWEPWALCRNQGINCAEVTRDVVQNPLCSS